MTKNATTSLTIQPRIRRGHERHHLRVENFVQAVFRGTTKKHVEQEYREAEEHHQHDEHRQHEPAS